MNGIRICSFFGFEVRLDLSWFVVFFLILWTFAKSEFPRIMPGLSALEYVIMAWSGAVLFFGSVLLHELAHSAVARARRIPVEGITLFVFGGMQRIRSDAGSPRDEFMITAVGPLTSGALAAAFYGVARVGQALGASVAVTGVADYLAFVNLILAVLNLIPGFPLDGGRLFRSIVWHVSKDLRRATRWAAYSGRAFGLLMIGFGALNMFRGFILAGMWLVFIGLFLTQAAEAGYRQLLMRRILEGVQVSEAMSRSPETVAPDLTLRDLVDNYFLKRRYNAFPVEGEDGMTLGIITLAQVKDIERDLWPTTEVTEVMMPVCDAVRVRPGDSLAEVLTKLEREGVGRALVIDRGHLEGVITRADVAQWLDRYQQLH
jgi:Zn-dependent protease